MRKMANRIGVARALSNGFIGVALIAGLISSCGKDSSPHSAAPEPEPSGKGGEPDAGGSVEPEPVAGDAGSSSEGPPLISGFNPLPRPPANGGCTPGETQPCLRDQLCMGVAHCAQDGTAFGECVCEATPSFGSGVVGRSCETDAECSGGHCLRADGNDYLGAGGPAGGYCSFTCVNTTDCTPHDPQSRCVPLGPDSTSYCIRTCLSKDAETGEAKCLNRSNLVCVSVAADGIEALAVDRQEGYCAPRCGHDGECPLGRVCHRQAGICTDIRSPGAPIGSSCTLDTNCDGRACEDRSDGVGVCTAECVLGSLSGCGYARDEAKRKAACITPLVAAGRFSEGPGDLGLCRELCDVDSDCLQAAAGFVCRPVNAALAEFTGRLGACVRGAN
jgi:hypothetical protein